MKQKEIRDSSQSPFHHWCLPVSQSLKEVTYPEQLDFPPAERYPAVSNIHTGQYRSAPSLVQLPNSIDYVLKWKWGVSYAPSRLVAAAAMMIECGAVGTQHFPEKLQSGPVAKFGLSHDILSLIRSRDKSFTFNGQWHRDMPFQRPSRNYDFIYVRLLRHHRDYGRYHPIASDMTDEV